MTIIHEFYNEILSEMSFMDAEARFEQMIRNDPAEMEMLRQYKQQIRNKRVALATLGAGVTLAGYIAAYNAYKRRHKRNKNKQSGE